MLTYTEAEKLLETARSPKAGKPIANNTRLFRRGPDTFVIRLHNTDIVTILQSTNPDVVKGSESDTWVLNTGGWRTTTTKERINRYAPGTVYSVRGVWHYDWTHHDGGHSACIFEDGMRVGVNGPLTEPRELEEKTVDIATKRAEKAVRKYIDGFVTSVLENGLEQPGPGDCWGCAMEAKEAPRDPLEALAGPMGIDHILQHFEEGYRVPSLLWRAIRLRGYKQPEFIWHLIFTARGGVDCRLLRDVLRTYFTRLKPFLVEAMRPEARLDLKVQESRDIRDGKIQPDRTDLSTTLHKPWSR